MWNGLCRLSGLLSPQGHQAPACARLLGSHNYDTIKLPWANECENYGKSTSIPSLTWTTKPQFNKCSELDSHQVEPPVKWKWLAILRVTMGRCSMVIVIAWGGEMNDRTTCLYLQQTLTSLGLSHTCWTPQSHRVPHASVPLFRRWPRVCRALEQRPPTGLDTSWRGDRGAF